ncbi:ricin-type beta-trefoil lectin domain protein [Streptomyces sp. NPDC048527]|uniref:ricin-type beta-trefoil lectin domain protein n=1 Tax=Streptomyces sp. NPDC048527 TaxID=3365568 RepID=UPI003710BB71
MEIPAVPGRPGPPRKRVFVAAAAAGGVLITVPLVLSGGGSEPRTVSDQLPIPVTKAASPSATPTSAQTLSPGAFPPARATASASASPGRSAPSATFHVPSTAPGRASSTAFADAAKKTAAGAFVKKTKAETAAKPGVHIKGYGSNRCVDVSDHQKGVSADGSHLQLFDCASRPDEKWTLASDGTIHSMGLCMDVAWGSTSAGAAVQLARCSGNPAQQWVLTPEADLVNPQANKCLDAVNSGTRNGTKLQIWDCSGTSNQKWHTVTA